MTAKNAGRCVIVGDVMMDVTARIATAIEFASDTPAQVSVQPGGSAANTAAWMAASGRQVTFVGCVGDDAFGRDVREVLIASGVEPRLTVSGVRATGTCVVIVDDHHERTMFPDKGANDELDASAVVALGLVPGDHVHISGYVLLNPHARQAGLRILAHARAAGATTSLDPASAGPLRQQREDVIDALRLVDIVIANGDEAAVLTGADDPLDSVVLLAEMVATAVVKRGSLGAVARDAADSVTQPALTATVVDTTGAGDAFAAGFLGSWLAGGALSEAVRAGQELAAEAVGRVGAGPLGR